jgi:hypothetical protein
LITVWVRLNSWQHVYELVREDGGCKGKDTYLTLVTSK